MFSFQSPVSKNGKRSISKMTFIQDLKTFKKFKQLPVEIQLLVWKHAIKNNRRIIRIFCAGNHYHLEAGDRYYISPIFLACKQSNAEAKKQYTRILACPLYGNPTRSIPGKENSTVLINFEVDTLYFVSTVCNTRSGTFHPSSMYYQPVLLSIGQMARNSNSGKHMKPGSVIKHVAFDASMVDELFYPGRLFDTTRSEAAYRLYEHHKAMKSISLVIDYSGFSHLDQTRYLHKYKLQTLDFNALKSTNKYKESYKELLIKDKVDNFFVNELLQESSDEEKHSTFALKLMEASSKLEGYESRIPRPIVCKISKS